MLEQVIGCRVDRLNLRRTNHHDLDLGALAAALEKDYDLVILVNPNSPTGRHVDRQELEGVLRLAPVNTRGGSTSLTSITRAGSSRSGGGGSEREHRRLQIDVQGIRVERDARSLSLRGHPPTRVAPRHPPPWVVSLPAQVAAVAARKDPDYYRARYAQTAQLRRILATVRQHRESLPQRTCLDRANSRHPRDTAARPGPGIPGGIASVVVSRGMA